MRVAVCLTVLTVLAWGPPSFAADAKPEAMIMCPTQQTSHPECKTYVRLNADDHTQPHMCSAKLCEIHPSIKLPAGTCTWDCPAAIIE